MAEKFQITVENKLMKEKRDIHIYHHSTRSSHIISYDSSIDFPLLTVEKDDYLYISLVRGPGNVWADCLIQLPLWVDFEFSSRGDLTLKHSPSRDVRQMVLKIPPGPPLWELKLMRATEEEISDKVKVIITER